MKVFLPGGAGLVGLNLIQKILEAHSDWEILVVDKKLEAIRKQFEENNMKMVSVEKKKLDEEEIEEVMQAHKEFVPSRAVDPPFMTILRERSVIKSEIELFSN